MSVARYKASHASDYQKGIDGTTDHLPNYSFVQIIASDTQTSGINSELNSALPLATGANSAATKNPLTKTRTMIAKI
jgi:hypothetical protein